MVTILASFAFVLALGLGAYGMFFPRDKFYGFEYNDGRTITFSRTGVSFGSPSDHFAVNGFDHIDSYVVRMFSNSDTIKSLNMFSPDGERGIGLLSQDGAVEVFLTVDSPKEAEKELLIRSFFDELQLSPSQDYLFENGGVPDSARVLMYPIEGNVTETAMLAKEILRELCGINPSDALNINYSEYKKGC